MSRHCLPKQSRRTVLATIGSVTTGVSLAGCTTSRSGGDTEASATEAASTETATATLDPPIEHPSAVGIEDEPTLGASDPAEAEAAIILFSDPSCPSCRKWHEQVWAPLKENHLDPGTVSLVYRTYPNVSVWGEKVVQAFEATYDRSVDAFWAVLEAVYADHDEFDVGTAQEIESWVADNTDIDAGGIADEAYDGEYDSRIEQDEHAADNADMTSIPAYTIVRDGEVFTTGVGVQSYDNVEHLLGV